MLLEVVGSLPNGPLQIFIEFKKDSNINFRVIRPENVKLKKLKMAPFSVQFRVNLG